jgi:hypothetical protein
MRYELLSAFLFGVIMRCVVLIALVMSMAAAGRAESAFARTLHVDSELVRSALDTAIRHDTSLDRPAAATTSPLLPLLPLLPSADAPKSLPPAISGVGIGLQVGSPTALTIKFGGAQQDGFVLGFGALFRYPGAYNGLSVHGDYIKHLATLANTAQVAVTFYAGVGAWLTLLGDGYSYGFFNASAYNAFVGVGVRVPVGISLTVSQAPVDIYLEADPALFVFPGIDFGVGASLGFRVHF